MCNSQVLQLSPGRNDLGIDHTRKLITVDGHLDNVGEVDEFCWDSTGQQIRAQIPEKKYQAGETEQREKESGDALTIVSDC